MRLSPASFHALKMCSSAPIAVCTEACKLLHVDVTFFVLFCSELLIVHSILFTAMLLCTPAQFVQCVDSIVLVLFLPIKS